ncbi:MAG: TerB family tellurite resistance protein [Pseudomonadota bacterium]
MLERLINILSGAEDAPDAEGQNAGRVAVAAVLVEAARADDVYLEAERAMIDSVLAERYGLTAQDAAALRADGEVAQAEAVDLVRFTRAIKDAVPHEDRVSVIEAVWRVILSDDDRHPDESALMRRIAGLLYVPDREVGLARQRVAAD